MAVDMTPNPDKTSINIPITFDYRGGRSSDWKNKILYSLLVVFGSIVLSVVLMLNGNISILVRICIVLGVLFVGLLILRFPIWGESHYSDMVETLIENNFQLDIEDIWQIFEVDDEPPYICYFKNGMKGIFVKMEKDTIIGKPSTNQFDHYTAIGDAYNTAHSLNMNIVHIDYMDTVGNDSRMKVMYEDLDKVENDDMHYLLKSMYNHLSEEMRQNYSCFDIYLFLTRDDSANFSYNVQLVANQMLGGNFITYKYLRKSERGDNCRSLFNLDKFDEYDACEYIISGSDSKYIIPISVTHADGVVDKLNDTQEERKKKLAELENRKKSSKSIKTESDEIDLF